MQVSPSSKVRDLGVDFDQYLTFHDHISGICKSTHFHLRGIGTTLVFLFLGAAIPFLYSEKVYTSVNSPAASVYSTECLDIEYSFPLLATVMCQISRCTASSHLLFFSFIFLSTSVVPASMVLDYLNTVSCMLYRDSVIPQMDQGCTILCIISVDALCMSHTLSL